MHAKQDFVHFENKDKADEGIKLLTSLRKILTFEAGQDHGAKGSHRGGV